MFTYQSQAHLGVPSIPNVSVLKSELDITANGHSLSQVPFRMREHILASTGDGAGRNANHESRRQN
jgi:hypothetical protein